jgi:hypothetical protein
MWYAYDVQELQMSGNSGRSLAFKDETDKDSLRLLR